MSRAYCPDCDGKITFDSNPKVGTKLVCPHCDAELEVIDVNPVELDWVYEESDEDWDDEDEDDDDY